MSIQESNIYRDERIAKLITFKNEGFNPYPHKLNQPIQNTSHKYFLFVLVDMRTYDTALEL